MILFKIPLKKIVDLESIPSQELSEKLLEEIRSLESETPEFRNAQLQSIFSRILEFQPVNKAGSTNDSHFEKYEQRLFTDLVSAIGLSDIDFVKDFLKSSFKYGGNSSKVQQRKLLLQVFDYYDTHSEDAIEKFNYIFRSSEAIGIMLLDEPELLKTQYFSNRVMELFSKESLSQLYRFKFVMGYQELENLVKEENAKALFVVSQMCNYSTNVIGHDFEFMSAVFKQISTNPKFFQLLSDSYDSLVHGDEKAHMAKKELEPEFRKLMNYILNQSYDKRALGRSDHSNISTLADFMKYVSKQSEEFHDYVVRPGTLSKIEDETFDPENDFLKITDKQDLQNFKRGILMGIYGISFEEAKHYVSQYGQYMEALEKGIVDEDKEILQVLKSICSIVKLDETDQNFESKISQLQTAYAYQIKKNGPYFQDKYVSTMILQGLFNRMIMNTYNKRNLLASSCEELGRDDDVVLLDAGYDFDMVVTSFSGVESFYQSGVNMASKWNTAALSEGQGLCVSHISSQNLGVISLQSPIIGFSKIPQYALDSMGPNDIFTNISSYNLRMLNENRGRVQNRFFIPANVMSDEQRYGYNEILLERFLSQDEKGDIKIQPSYVVCYKMNENYKQSLNYKL